MSVGVPGGHVISAAATEAGLTAYHQFRSGAPVDLQTVAGDAVYGGAVSLAVGRILPRTAVRGVLPKHLSTWLTGSHGQVYFRQILSSGLLKAGFDIYARPASVEGAVARYGDVYRSPRLGRLFIGGGWSLAAPGASCW
jgi:hypothetical protein